ncbi:alpha-lactalbumin [Ornithorhynchus anatinus]|uniref:Lactose synthase B protein n=1 Tax=Ornithorhynchus anatinus TaxID=9258 RepID=A0A6I8NMR9_ORNAN|nr:alpha-lactalbumin [Ornithorhynchus anatinus]
MKRLLLLCVLLVASRARIFQICELSRVLKENATGGFHGVSLEEWLCVIFHESGYDSQALNYYNGSSSHGLFQINQPYWCDDEDSESTEPSVNACQIPCSKLLDDDILDDIECAKKIVKEPKGITAWEAWQPFCNDDLDQWKVLDGPVLSPAQRPADPRPHPSLPLGGQNPPGLSSSCFDSGGVPFATLQ